MRGRPVVETQMKKNDADQIKLNDLPHGCQRMPSDTLVCSEQRERMQCRKGQVVEEGVGRRPRRVEFHGPVDAVVEHGVPTGVQEAVDFRIIEPSQVFDLVVLHNLLHQVCLVASAISKNPHLQRQS